MFLLSDSLPSTASGMEIVEFLRSQSVEDIVSMMESCCAVLDGHVLPAEPQSLYEAAKFNHVDLMIGCNSDEGQVFIFVLMPRFGVDMANVDLAAARAAMTGFVKIYLDSLQNNLDAMFTEYLEGLDDNSPPKDIHQALVDFMGDVMFFIPTLTTANLHSRTYLSFLFCTRKAFLCMPFSRPSVCCFVYCCQTVQDRSLVCIEVDWKWINISVGTIFDR